MNTKQIFWDLFNANSESEVDMILEKYKNIFDDDNNWAPYGGNKGNCGTFENQQSSAIPALVEKITNSIDAILIKECLLKGIEPNDSKAPDSMKSAVEMFFNVPNGEIAELGNKKRSELADNLQIIATGKKDTPSILIYDNGIGQHHSEFQKSFLSLHSNNKANIQFVQGKYNMGSTGSVVFCGDKKYQLIGSKKNDVNSSFDDSDFGFTLVRRHPLKEKDQAKMTWYEYFCPNQKIPHFSGEDFDFGLLNRQFESGSIVKLYSYELPKGSKGDISTDLYRDLNQYLFDLPIPLKVYETRQHYKVKNVNKIILGNRARIATDRNENVEWQGSFDLSSRLGDFSVPINVVLFKPSVDHREFIKKKSLIFSINGQIHASLGWSYITQELGFQLIKKQLLINVDCTNIPTHIRQDLFMANRTHVKKAKIYDTLIEEVTNILQSSKELKRINNERKDAILRNSDSDKDLIKDLMSSIPLDKDVINLLKKDGSLDFLKSFGTGHTPSSKNIKNDKLERRELNRFPSIFNIKKQKNGKVYKTIPINNHGYVDIETDVSNDYLFRPLEKGKFKIEVLQRRPKTDKPIGHILNKPNEISDILNISREGPDNGKIRLIIKPNYKAKVGDEVSVKASLTAPGGDFECIFDVKVDEKISKSNKKEKVAPTQSFPSIPKLIKAYKQLSEDQEDGLDWDSPELNWDGYDIVKVLTGASDTISDNIVDGIVINMDSHALKKFISKNKIKSSNKLSLVTKKYYTSIYLHTLFLYSIFYKMQKDESEDINLKDIEIDEFISKLIKPYANFLLYENNHLVEIYDED